MSKTEDINFGLTNEQKAIPSIESFLKTELKKDPNPYSIYDWWNETKTVFVELKSRRNTHNQYDTTIIGENKIQMCTNPDIKYYFVFLFTDGLYYIKYDKELFKNFTIEKDLRIKYRYDVGKVEFKKVVHIPYKLLNKLPNTIII